MASLCSEALQDDDAFEIPAMIFTEAPEGMTISQKATTITLSQRGAVLFHDLVEILRKDSESARDLSEDEVGIDLKSALFKGTASLERGEFDSNLLAEWLLERLQEGRVSWVVLLPISGLKVPEQEGLSLASGVFKRIGTIDRGELQDQHTYILRLAKWDSPENRERGVERLSQELDEILDSSETWFQVEVVGRQETARLVGEELAALGIDILLFWGRYVGIEPESSNIGFPTQSRIQGRRYFQFSEGESSYMGNEASGAILYNLDESRLRKLKTQPAFEHIQRISTKVDPTEFEQKLLLAIQQFAESTRLPSPTLRLVWYLSALETVLAKEDEGNRHKKVERRIRHLLGDDPASWVVPLYDKRRLPVHYGTRNRVGEEIVTRRDVEQAQLLAYLGIISCIKYVNSVDEHAEFVKMLDDLNTP